LFGYRHGAFTGARREGMRGKVLQASGGTLFLDEIGDMPPQLQTRLLRVLEEQEVMPLGSEQPIQVDLHIISATHRDLPSLISEGVFREDLYYRLNGITLTLPPLREREDLPELLRCALAAENDTGSEVAMEEAAFGALQAYDWPGNVRQLRNVLRTALALCDDHLIRLSDLPREVAFPEAPRLFRQVPPPGGPPAAEGPGEAGALASAERLALLQELERQRWNVSSTANALGMSRNTLYRKMKKHNIEASRSRSTHQQGCVPGA
jgi:transcriptional regulator of acetoin/glycerol metabolism